MRKTKPINKKKKVVFKSVINMMRSINGKCKHWKVVSYTTEDHSLATSEGRKVHFTARWFFTEFIHFIKVPEISLVKHDIINYLRWAKTDDTHVLWVNIWTESAQGQRGNSSCGSYFLHFTGLPENSWCPPFYKRFYLFKSEAERAGAGGEGEGGREEQQTPH